MGYIFGERCRYTHGAGDKLGTDGNDPMFVRGMGDEMEFHGVGDGKGVNLSTLQNGQQGSVIAEPYRLSSNKRPKEQETR